MARSSHQGLSAFSVLGKRDQVQSGLKPKGPCQARVPGRSRSSSVMNRPHVDPALLGELHQITHRHWARLAVFAGLYVMAGYGAYRLVETDPAGWFVYPACLPLYILAGA